MEDTGAPESKRYPEQLSEAHPGPTAPSLLPVCHRPHLGTDARTFFPLGPALMVDTARALGQLSVKKGMSLVRRFQSQPCFCISWQKERESEQLAHKRMSSPGTVLRAGGEQRALPSGMPYASSGSSNRLSSLGFSLLRCEGNPYGYLLAVMARIKWLLESFSFWHRD